MGCRDSIMVPDADYRQHQNTNEDVIQVAIYLLNSCFNHYYLT